MYLASGRHEAQNTKQSGLFSEILMEHEADWTVLTTINAPRWPHVTGDDLEDWLTGVGMWIHLPCRRFSMSAT